MPYWIGVGDKPIFQCQHTQASTTQGQGAINKQKCEIAPYVRIGQNDFRRILAGAILDWCW